MAQICSLLAHAYNYGGFILCGSSKGRGRREGEGWDSAFGHLFCCWAPSWASTCILGSRLYLRMTFCALNPLISVMDTGLTLDTGSFLDEERRELRLQGVLSREQVTSSSGESESRGLAFSPMYLSVSGRDTITPQACRVGDRERRITQENSGSGIHKF